MRLIGEMMQRKTQTMPRAPVARIMLSVGAKRVSADGVDAFADVLNRIGDDISISAAQYAKNSGRKTIQKDDVKMAAKR